MKWKAFAFAGALLVGASPALAQVAQSAVASGPCAAAINAKGNSIVNIRQVCNYGSLTPAQRRTIDRLVTQAQLTAKTLQTLVAADSRQNGALRTLAASDTGQNAMLQTISSNDRGQDQRLDEQRDQLALIFQLLGQRAAAPGASSEVKTAVAELEQGKVETAVRVLGKEATAAAAKPGTDASAAAAIFVQQAALLQTQDIPGARKALERALALDPGNPAALSNAALLATLTGDMRRATELNKELLAITRGRYTKNTDDAVAQRDLAVALASLGQAELNGGDYAAAEARYTESLSLLERLCERDPTSLEWLRLLGFAYANISGAQAIAGNVALALESAEKGLGIARQLANQFPGDAMRYELVARHGQVGELQTNLGRSDAALASFQSALTLLAPIIQASPQVESGYADLVNIHNRTGYVRQARGDLDGAIRDYGKAIEIANARAARNPTNIYWKRLLMVAYGGLGDVQLNRPLLSPADMSRNTGEALASYDRAYQLTAEMAALDPTNQIWQSDLWYAQTRLGRARAMRGENLVALEHYTKSLDILKALAAGNPKVAIFQAQLASTYWSAAMVQGAQGKRPEAMENFLKAVDQGKKVAAMEPGVMAYRRDLALYIGTVGQAQAMDGNFPAALDNFRQGLELRRQVAASDPNNGQWQLDLALNYMVIGTVLGFPASERRMALTAAIAKLEAHQANGNSPPPLPGTIEYLKTQLAGLGDSVN